MIAHTGGQTDDGRKTGKPRKMYTNNAERDAGNRERGSNELKIMARNREDKEYGRWQNETRHPVDVKKDC